MRLQKRLWITTAALFAVWGFAALVLAPGVQVDSPYASALSMFEVGTAQAAACDKACDEAGKCVRINGPSRSFCTMKGGNCVLQFC